jgi:pyridoxamine 5'-phosphate oxidase
LLKDIEPSRSDRPLTREELDSDPIAQFHRWFEQAAAVNPMPEAMCIATIDEDGMPDARMVLLKGVDQEGFRFYTNHDGVKATQIAANPVAALVFHWVELDRQVRIRGPVERLSEAESDAYYASRGRGSQIGAWASPQSRPLGDPRSELDELTEQAEKRFEGVEEIPRPPHWGGYLIRPVQVEFWQGRRARLHDRFRYLPEGDGWSILRLAP